MNNDTGCREYNDLSRRQFMSGSGKLALGLGVMGSLLPRVTMAQAGGDSSRDTIMQVYLRGGADGLSICVPYAEDAYYAYRPTIAIPRPDSSANNRALDLDGFFGVSPAWQPLMEAYGAGHLLFVQATGLMNGSRSHFDNQRWTEVGQIETIPLGTGWLGRHLLTSSPSRPGSTLRGIALGQAVPMTLAGGPGTSAVRTPSDYSLQGSSPTQRENFVRDAYSADKDMGVKKTALSILETIQLLKNIDFTHYAPAGGAVYPNSDIGFAFKSAAALIRADIGVEALTVDLGGWDTHDSAGPNGGWMHQLMGDLASAMGAFHRDLTSANKFDHALVSVMSEFGRTARENGTRGTDHGTGNAMLVLGGGVNGGRVLTNWPGMNNGALYEQQDLKITIDYRDILAEIVSKRLGNGGNISTIFPGFTPTFRGAVA